MDHQEIVNKYLKCFCCGDLDGLGAILDPELRFSGPLHYFDSASQYLESLQNDPPEACTYKILSITESVDSIAVFYEYQKIESTVLVAQLFKIRSHKIYEILLTFDVRSLI